MDAVFELHRTDDRPFKEGEGGKIFAKAAVQTQYPMILKDITQLNGSVTGTIRLMGTHQYYRVQLLLTQLQKVPDVQTLYRGTN